MKTTILFLGLLTLVKESYGHYAFPYLIVNGTVSQKWQYVRDVGYDKNQGVEIGKTWPLYDVSSSDIICNREAGAGPKTVSATVAAGDEVAFRVAPYLGITTAISHPGPGQVYMSKAPNDDVEHYDGKGDWFKVGYVGPSSDSSWTLLGQTDIKFKVPKTTPSGKYLARVEHLFVHDKLNETQIYVNCAHLNVVGSGGGKPTNLIKFPGGYRATDPGILVTTKQAGEYDLLNYKPPGPAVWQG